MASINIKSLIDNLQIMWGDEAYSRPLPRTPGVYAWYRPLFLDAEDLEGDVTNHVLFFNTWREAQTGWVREIEVKLLKKTSAGDALPDKARKGLTKISSYEHLTQFFGKWALACSILATPLYIGKADNLRERIGAHLDGRTDFAKRAKSDKVQLSRLVLLIMPFCSDHTTGSGMNRVFEAFLARISNPIYGRRF